MKRYMMSYGPAVAALFVLGLAGPLPAAHAAKFRANGVAAFESRHANIDQGTFEDAKSAPGGPFSGAYSQKVTASGDTLDGSAVLDYGGGDALLVEYHLEFDYTIGLYLGSYVVVGGTGNLEGAAGSGVLISERGSEAAFSMFGTLD